MSTSTLLKVKVTEKNIFDLEQIEQGDVLRVPFRYDLAVLETKETAILIVNQATEENLYVTVFPKGRQSYFVTFSPEHFTGASHSLEIAGVPVKTGDNILRSLLEEKPETSEEGTQTGNEGGTTTEGGTQTEPETAVH